MSLFENWHQPWRVLDNRGAVLSLPSVLDGLGSERTALLTSRSVERSGLGDLVAMLIGRRLVDRSSSVVPHVPRSSALVVAEWLRETGADAIVTVGGGSVVDTAKAARLVLRFGIESESGFDEFVRRPQFGPPDRSETLRLVALPTTLSGAEFTNTAGIVDEGRHHKDLYSYDWLSADTVILDPDLVAETPRRLWHSTGIKLLSDAIEQSLGANRHPVTSALCLAAIRSLRMHLPAGPTDAAAALDCLRATWLSMFATSGAQVFPGAAAGLRHQLGAMTQAGHGDLAAVLLAPVLRTILPDSPDLEPLREALDAESARPEHLVGAIERLLALLDVPRALSELGIGTEADLAEIAAGASRSVAGGNAPRPLTPRELEAVLHEAA